MKKNGAPVEWAHTLEPIVVGINGIALCAKPKNPSAARLFIDFLLSKEGQEIIRARGRIPARSDVEPLSPNMSISKLKLKAVPSDIGLRSDSIKDFRRIFGL